MELFWVVVLVVLVIMHAFEIGKLELRIEALEATKSEPPK